MVNKDQLELVTVIVYVCADSTSLKPGLLFSGSEIYHEYYEEDRIIVATSENNWTSNFISTEFIKSFVPQAKEWNLSGQPILLIYNGHQDTIPMGQLNFVKQQKNMTSTFSA
ncbi:hypothetical protein BDR04DRAFT_1164277 [Suillus decipiens]|nr:hypothetical protein BDR04DRAFT_1164461 [Suillus decipiens]KAG2063080.1 hypothetical protein BDR04DRAFT_1164277 [Suillus decipiens]